MAARRDVNSPAVNSSQLCLDVNVEVSHINLYYHPAPKNQELLLESKKFKNSSKG